MTVLAYRSPSRFAVAPAPLPPPKPVRPIAVPTLAQLDAPRNWNRLATSLFLHAAAILLLIKLVALLPAAQIITRNHESVTLLVPSFDKPEPPPPPKVIARIHELPKVPPPAPVLNPKIEAPVVKQLPPEAPKIAAFKSAMPELPKPVVTKKIAEGVFDPGSSAKPTVQAHVHDVQTGGFGDPNGVAGKSNTERKVTVASAGGFDLPSGSGNGNGDAGSHGQRGVVASSGFGSGVAGPGSGSGNARTAVNTGGFGDASTASAQTVARRTTAPQVTPVAILFKPKPAYTAEARELHIEGEVLLAVMFSASGDVRVLRVVRGLGHGLDEAAEVAGQKIRFEPAKKDGRPYDSDAVVHIVFELAE